MPASGGMFGVLWGEVNLPRIDKPLTSSQLRDRVLAQMNGESVNLSSPDRARQARVLARLLKERAQR
jgi:hypothetical protein